MRKFLTVSILALGFAAPAHAVTIFQDNFNSNAADQLNGTPSGWTTTAGTADIIGAGGNFDWYPGNGSYIDLDGSDGALGQNTVLTTSNTYNLAGGKYKFSLDYGINHNDGPDSDQIVFGIVGGPSFTLDANALDHSASVFSHAFSLLNLSAMNDVRFFIQGISIGSVDQSGGIVDNVEISAIPLPASALLLLTGLLGIGTLSSLRRRRSM